MSKEDEIVRSIERTGARPPKLPPPLEGPIAVENWLDELMRVSEQRRFAVDVIVPDPEDQTLAQTQQKRYGTFIVHHGFVMGVITLAFRLRQIDEAKYVTSIQRMKATLMPTVVGVASGQG